MHRRLNILAQSSVLTSSSSSTSGDLSLQWQAYPGRAQVISSPATWSDHPHILLHCSPLEKKLTPTFIQGSGTTLPPTAEHGMALLTQAARVGAHEETSIANAQLRMRPPEFCPAGRKPATRLVDASLLS